MSCEDFERRLNEVLDERGNPAIDRKLVEHARRCPSCQRLLSLQMHCLGCLHEALQVVPSLLVQPVGGQASKIASEITQRQSPGRAFWGRGQGSWKRWSAMVSPLAVSLALAVVMWSAGRQERAAVVSERVHGRTASRGSWPNAGALAWSGPRRRLGGGERVSGGDLQTQAPSSSRRASVNEMVASEDLMIEGDETRIREQLTRWRESIATLPSPPMEGVSQWAEGMRPVADSVGCLVEAVRESVWSGRSAQPESSLDTTWVIDGKWVA